MARRKVADILRMKKRGERVVMLTAYDYPLARLADAAGVDIILVGDSLANVVLGLESTRAVGMAEMIHHSKAVNRAVEKAMLVGDMPYRSYATPVSAVKNARRFRDEAGCGAVKLEWHKDCAKVTEAIVSCGIPVIGHVGLTPQTAHRMGGMKVQGRDAASARRIIGQAKALEKAGCFSIVLECVPDHLAALITQELSIPTIGIGAGRACDGQVLVIHDILGLFDGFHPKFVKRYVNAGDLIAQGISRYTAEVRKGTFPDAAHSFAMDKKELSVLTRTLKGRTA